jgi:hypothetical protein
MYPGNNPSEEVEISAQHLVAFLRVFPWRRRGLNLLRLLEVWTAFSTVLLVCCIFSASF